MPTTKKPKTKSNARSKARATLTDAAAQAGDILACLVIELVEGNADRADVCRQALVRRGIEVGEIDTGRAIEAYNPALTHDSSS